MPITDKTRKILWGRSGNRCAMCRWELVIDATSADDESVVGEECHIVSRKGQGPRHDPAFPNERLDDPENLILLCRVHHKMVDDQFEKYTVALLLELKRNHEKWVSETLSERTQQARVRVVRVQKNIPTHLVRVTTGKEVFSIVNGACASAFEHDEPQSEAEADLFAGFFQEAEDWGDISDDLDAAGRVRAAYRLSNLIRELEEAGFWVFAGREVRRIEGGVEPPSPFPVAIVRIARSTHPEIIRVNMEAEEKH
jgi:hypothetical protein